MHASIQTKIKVWQKEDFACFLKTGRISTSCRTWMGIICIIPNSSIWDMEDVLWSCWRRGKRRKEGREGGYNRNNNMPAFFYFISPVLSGFLCGCEASIRFWYLCILRFQEYWDPERVWQVPVQGPTRCRGYDSQQYPAVSISWFPCLPLEFWKTIQAW